jgi:hypothetical protein
MKFYKFTYWLLESAVSKIDEEIKNEMFIKSFFQTQDIKVRSNQSDSKTYGMKILIREEDCILGQLGINDEMIHHKDSGEMYVTEKIEDTPFIYFFADTRHRHQNFYIQTSGNSSIYSTVNSLITKLNKFAKILCPVELEVNFEYNIDDLTFDEEISKFDVLQSVNITLKPRNFYIPNSELKIIEVINDLKTEFNSNELTIGLKNQNGLIKNKISELKEIINWINHKAGTWKIAGIKRNKQEHKSKEEVISRAYVDTNKEILNDPKLFLKSLKGEFFEN